MYSELHLGHFGKVLNSRLQFLRDKAGRVARTRSVATVKTAGQRRDVTCSALLHQVIVMMPMPAPHDTLTALQGKIVTPSQGRCQQNQQYNFLHYLVFFPYLINDRPSRGA